MSGPKLQQLWLQLPDGKRWSLQGPRLCPGFSRHTAVASQRSSGHQKAKEQRAEKENGEKQDKGPREKGSNGERELGRQIGPFPLHQMTVEGHLGTNLPTNPPNRGPSGLGRALKP